MIPASSLDQPSFTPPSIQTRTRHLVSGFGKDQKRGVFVNRLKNLRDTKSLLPQKTPEFTLKNVEHRDGGNMNSCIRLIYIFLLLSVVSIGLSSSQVAGFKKLQGSPENGNAVFVDRENDCAIYTEYIGDNIGTLVRCITASGILSDKEIYIKIRQLINQFVFQ